VKAPIHSPPGGDGDDDIDDVADVVDVAAEIKNRLAMTLEGSKFCGEAKYTEAARTRQPSKLSGGEIVQRRTPFFVSGSSLWDEGSLGKFNIR